MCPKELRVRDKRTLAFISAFCEKLDIIITVLKDLPVLNEVEQDFLRHFSMSETEEITEFLSLIGEMVEDGAGLEDLPPEIIEQMELLLQREDLPEELLDKAEQVLYQGRPRLAKSDFKTVKPKKR